MVRATPCPGADGHHLDGWLREHDLYPVSRLAGTDRGLAFIARTAGGDSRCWHNCAARVTAAAAARRPGPACRWRARAATPGRASTPTRHGAGPGPAACLIPLARARLLAGDSLH